MSKKKILWIVLLIVVIILIIAVAYFLPKQISKYDNISNNTTNFNKAADKKEKEDEPIIEKNYEKIQLDDGILYTSTGKKEEADVTITTNFFDTSLNDMYVNPSSYYNKKIEIEGMYLENKPYTFVGRYSTSNVCQNCPAGYSYFEYVLNGKIDEEFKDEDTWIKVIGTLKKGNDETSGYQDFYYLDVLTLEIMNEKGETTVVN